MGDLQASQFAIKKKKSHIKVRYTTWNKSKNINYYYSTQFYQKLVGFENIYV